MATLALTCVCCHTPLPGGARQCELCGTETPSEVPFSEPEGIGVRRSLAGRDARAA